MMNAVIFSGWLSVFRGRRHVWSADKENTKELDCNSHEERVQQVDTRYCGGIGCSVSSVHILLRKIDRFAGNCKYNAAEQQSSVCFQVFGSLMYFGWRQVDHNNWVPSLSELANGMVKKGGGRTDVTLHWRPLDGPKPQLAASCIKLQNPSSLHNTKVLFWSLLNPRTFNGTFRASKEISRLRPSQVMLEELEQFSV